MSLNENNVGNDVENNNINENVNKNVSKNVNDNVSDNVNEIDNENVNDNENDNVNDNENINENVNVNDIQIIQQHPIPDFINLEILKEYVKKDIDGNREYFDDLKITYKISDPKKAEWILNKAINGGELIGNGSTNFDIVIKEKNIGIDVSVLTLNGNYTNEKSIMQNFSASSDLDSLFNNKKGEMAVDIFKQKLLEKYEFEEDKDDKDEKKIYFLIFICKSKNIYLTCLELNPKNVENMKFSCFTKSCKNITIDNFIDKKYGNVKLYKSKKRLELRLHKDILNNECSVKLY